MAESHREEIAKLEALYASSPGGRVFVHLAEALRKAGEYERARGILSEGLGRHSDSASGYVVLGRLLTDLQADAEAEEAFRRVLQLDGGNLIALRGLADLALRGGRRQEAAGYYTDLLARNPSGDDVRHLLAELELGDTVTPQDMDEAAWAGTLSAAEDAPPTDWEWDWADGGASEHPDTAVASFSAAPGDTGDVEPAEPEFGLVDVDSAASTDEADSFEAGLTGGGDWVVDARDADLSELLGEEAAGSAAGFDLSELSLTQSEMPDDDPPQLPWAELPGISPDTELAADSLDATRFEVVHPAAAGLPQDADVVEFTEVDMETGPAWPDEEIEDHAHGDLQDTGPPDPRWVRDAGDGLVTETMADLYRSQGFHDRAADVYRALLRQRPGDASLTAKLQAAEAAQRIDRASSGPDSVQSEVDADGSESWLQGLGAWTAVPEDLPDETPYAWTRGADEDAEPEQPAATAAPAIGAYLRDLISWTPGEGRVDAVDAPVAEVDGDAVEAGRWPEQEDRDQHGIAGAPPEPVDLELVYEHPAEEISELGDPWTPSEPEVTEPVDASAAAGEEGVSAAAGEEGVSAAAGEEGVSAAAGEYEPWAYTPEDEPVEGNQDVSAEATSATTERGVSASDPWRNASKPVGAVEAAFNEWYLDDAPAMDHVPGEPAADSTSSTPEPVAEESQPPQAGPRLGDEPSEDEDEDEDLAMFRAWLQSLKK
jgi:tetratricopeptide (TPR) repeat protein